MFCARCGEQIADSTEICPLCGCEAALKVEAPPAIQTTLTGAAAAPGQIQWPAEPATIGPPIRRPDLKGVGGWLLVFCVLLTLVNPAVVVLLAWTGAYSEYFALYIGWAMFGFLTGALLWSVHRKAFILLWIYFGITLLILLLAVVGMALSEERIDFSQAIVAFRGLFYTCAWFYYFKRSDRVQATFGRNF